MEIDKEALKKRLTSLQYEVTQNKDTERPFTGEYDKHFKPGEYSCIVCSQKLFLSDQKFDSGCGWPAFSACEKGSVSDTVDRSYGMVRTETTCSKCGAHLGHVFDDGPKPTGIRYCINSASLQFNPKK